MKATSIETLNFQKSFAGTISGELNDFLATRKNTLRITDFSYSKLYPNRTEAFLTTTPNFSELFIKEKFYLLSTTADLNQYHEGYYLYSALPQQNPLIEALKAYNIIQGLTIIKKYPNSVELFFFATDIDDISINNYFINHLEYFESFISEFKEKCHNMLIKASQERFLLPENCHETLYMPIENDNVTSLKTSPNLPTNPIKNDRLKTNKLNLLNLLTPREKECMLLSINGLTAKNIAKALNISYRTVEKNFENIKGKFNCHTRHELAAKILNELY